MNSPEKPSEPTVMVGASVSFFAQPAKFRPSPPSISGNSGSQNRRCEQSRRSTPASTSGASSR